MANHVLLNNVDHKDLKINRVRSEAFGDNVMSSLAFPGEFRNLQAHYPIVFSRNPETGQTVPVALLGFMKNENLFLTERGWDAEYIPLALDMQPFLIGFSGDQQTVIHIDMDSPRVGNEGEPVFLAMGGNTSFLDHIIGVLDHVHTGHEQLPDFIAALEKYDLLEPFTLDVDLADGSTNRLAGFHIIKEESLYSLPAEALADLNEQQFLQPIFMAVASLSNFTQLIRRKNAKVLSGGASKA